jgi:hypothetical protein
VKFSLYVELHHLHIAQGHVDTFVPQQLHEDRQADAEAHHFGREAVAQAVRRDFSGTTSTPGCIG